MKRSCRTSCRTFCRAALCFLVVVAGLVGFSPCSSAATPQDSCYQPSRVSWRELNFRASKLGVTARASLGFRVVEARQVRRLLTALGTSPLVPDQPVVELKVGSGFLGRNSLSNVWLDQDTGRAFERRQIDSGKRQREKVYRFGASEVSSRRRVPADRAESEKPPEAWSESAEAAFPIKAGLLVSEPSVLFYLASTCSKVALERGQEVILFQGNELSRITMKLIEEVDLSVDYKKHGKRQNGTVRAMRLSLEARPFEDGAESEFELLGLEGTIHLYVDEATRLPLQVSGRISPVGKVNIKLVSVTED